MQLVSESVYSTNVSCYGARWFANPDRYGWYILIRVARVGFGPFFNLAAVILVKRFVIGKFKAGKRDMSQLGLLRHWLMGKLMPGGDLRKVCLLAFYALWQDNDLVNLKTC